jgi:hypothetical protein
MQPINLTYEQCADTHKHGGIDGQPWENTCKQEWQYAYGGNPDAITGRCYN